MRKSTAVMLVTLYFVLFPILLLSINIGPQVTSEIEQMYPIDEMTPPLVINEIGSLYPISSHVPTFAITNQQLSTPTDRPVYINNHEQLISLPNEYINSNNNPMDIQPFIPPTLLTTPDGVIPPDERNPVGEMNTVFPYSAVVHLNITWDDTGSVWCTGSMVSASTVMTAAHCLYDAVGHNPAPWSVNIVAYPGMNNTSSNPIPFGSCDALEYFVPTQWIEYAQPKEYDHGFVRLACTIGYESGILGFRTYTNSNFPTVLVGYPSDKQIHGEEMWYGFGSMTHSDAIFSYYSNDAVNGNSGSTVWQNGYPSCPFCIVAVHSNYFPSVPENGGPRAAGDLYAFLLYEKNYVTQQVFIPLIIWNE